MHVGLNLVYLVPGETGGMETYARELIPRLAAIEGLRLTAFVNRETAAGGSGPWDEVPHETVPVRARNRVEWVRGEQQHLPRMARSAGCEVVHSLASTAPLRGAFVRVTTIHDINYKMVPQAHFGIRGLGMRLLVPAAVRRAHRLIAVSSATRDDLVEHLGARRENIDVVLHGADGALPQGVTPEGELRERMGLGRRQVVLSASAKRPHKNLLRLIGALAGIAADRRPVLVLPGYRTDHEAELRARAELLGVGQDVRFLDWVPSPDLEGLHALAACVVFPSLYEGFGLPVLEAMKRGVPVACSNTSSLPEVAGDAALLFDPEDESAIRTALERLLGDVELSDRLRQAGSAHAAEFTWSRAAEQTARSYERALASP